MTGFPESVKIGPFRFAVEISDGPFVSDGDHTVLAGEIDHHRGVIRLARRGDTAPERTFVTFWHEVLHGIDDVAGTELSEDIVNRLAPVLAQVLMDNGFAWAGEAAA